MSTIRKYRQKRELSQEALARLVGVERSTVAKWEAGSNKPRADKLLALARVFQCSLDDLLLRKPDEYF